MRPSLNGMSDSIMRRPSRKKRFQSFCIRFIAGLFFTNLVDTVSYNIGHGITTRLRPD